MPRVSVRAVIIENEQILLCKHRDDRGFWYITPGGGVDDGETLVEAFHREMREELDAECEFGQVLGVREIIADRHPTTYLPQGFHQIEFFVEAQLISGPGEPLVPDPDQIGVEWLHLSQLTEVLFFPREMVEAFRDGDWGRFYFGEVR